MSNFQIYYILFDYKQQSTAMLFTQDYSKSQRNPFEKPGKEVEKKNRLFMDDMKKSMPQEHSQSVEKKLLNIIEVQRVSNGEYFQRVTSDYELILQCQESILHLSLNTAQEKNFRLMVCDEGFHKLQNGLLPLDIFQAFKYNPQVCTVNHSEGILTIETKYLVGKREKIQIKEVRMNNQELPQKTRQKIEFSRQARKLLEQKRKQDGQNKRNHEEKISEFEEKIRKYETKISKYQDKIRKYEEKESQYQVKVQKLQKTLARSSSESLVNQTTPFSKNFELQPSYQNFVLQKEVGGGYYQQLLLKTIVGKNPFQFTVINYHTATNSMFATTSKVSAKEFVVGVTDRLTQEQSQNSHDSGNAVCYDSLQGGCIHYGDEGQKKRKDVGIRGSDVCKVKVVVEIEKGKMMFIFTHKNNFTNQVDVECDILRETSREFVPFFQLAVQNDSLRWSLD